MVAKDAPNERMDFWRRSLQTNRREQRSAGPSQQAMSSTSSVANLGSVGFMEEEQQENI